MGLPLHFGTSQEHCLRHSPKARSGLRALPFFHRSSLMKRALAVALFVLVPAIALAQEYPQPGPEHEMLKETAGEWTCLCKMSDGTESKGVSTSKMECGG